MANVYAFPKPNSKRPNSRINMRFPDGSQHIVRYAYNDRVDLWSIEIDGSRKFVAVGVDLLRDLRIDYSLIVIADTDPDLAGFDSGAATLALIGE